MQIKTFFLLMILAMFLSTIAAASKTDLETLVNGIVDEGLAPGAAFVIVQEGRVVTAVAAGYANPDLKIPMTIDTPLRIASNTKPYVASTLIQIVHEQNLDLKTPINELLTDDWNSTLVDAGYDSGNITLNHLLTHSAGFRDHSDSWYFKAVSFLFRNFVWTPEEQLQIMLDLGGPQGPPGKLYSYSDSGYLILGQIIETLTNRTLAQNIRHYGKLDQLGLNSTWWEVEETPRGDLTRANQYMSGWNMTNINATVDLYGGGGLIASTRDMGVFIHQLFSKQPAHGGVFASELLQLQMLSTMESPDDSGYAKGIIVREKDQYRLYSHSGFWGTLVCHIPEINTTIAAAVTDHQGKSRMHEINNQLIKVMTSRLIN